MSLPPIIYHYFSRPLPYLRTLQLQEAIHALTPTTSENTGVFLNEYEKVASIGVQVRHRLTTHGFAMNITSEPRAWFDEIVACGLADVKSASVEGATGRRVDVGMEVPGIV